MNGSCDPSMMSRNLSHNQRLPIFEGQEIAETLPQVYIDRLVWKTGHSMAPESCHETTLLRVVNVYLPHIFHSTPQDSRAVVAVMSDVISQLKTIMPELKTFIIVKTRVGVITAASLWCVL